LRQWLLEHTNELYTNGGSKSMYFTYSLALREDIRDAVSADRLSPYLAATNNDLETAIDLYCWNASLSSALHGPLGVLEVALRNTFDRQLSATFGVLWHDDHVFLSLDNYFGRAIADAKSKITKRGKAVIPPRIIAGLSLGFWVNLARPRYVTSLWGPSLSRSFPAGVRRATVSGILDPLLKFRNRVAHHEPIFSKQPEIQYRNSLMLLGWLLPSLVGWVEHHSRVLRIIADGPYRAHHLF
jgi:hypothetical protein